MAKKTTKKTQTTGEGTVEMPKKKELVLFGARVLGSAEVYRVGTMAQQWPGTGISLDGLYVMAITPTQNGMIVKFADQSEERIVANVGLLYREA